MIKLAVLDMAGTTIDEDNVVYKTLQKAMAKHGHSFDLAFVLEHAAGKEKLNAIENLMETQNVQDSLLAKTIHKEFLTLLETAYLEMEVKTFPGMLDFFERLKEKGIKIVLNTGYDRATAELLLKKINWTIGKEIHGLVTASEVKNNRPHPDMIFLAMKEMGISDPKSVIKIGDSKIDIEEGKNAGCGLTVGVTTGAQTDRQLLQAMPNYIVDNLSALEHYL